MIVDNICAYIIANFARNRYILQEKNGIAVSKWQGRQDLNSRHPVLETGALPTELRP